MGNTKGIWILNGALLTLNFLNADETWGCKRNC